ncbi:MAG TPA: FtsX-like permease family protein [Anaerolineae bacterium]|nr:FtsX-like permease family protein [Anaerolineae bacterium]
MTTKSARRLRSLNALAFRNLTSRKTRTLLTTLGIILGVAVILAISVTNQSTLSSINTIFDEASGLAHLVVAPSSYTGVSGFPETTLARVRSVPGVAQAVPTLQARTLLAQDADGWKFEFGIGGTTGGNDLVLFGIDPEIDRAARVYKLDAGRFLEAGERSYSALFTQDYANEKNIARDEDVDVLLPNGGLVTLRAVGFLRKDGPGLINSGSVAFVPLEALQEMYARVGELDQIDVVAQPDLAASVEQLADLKRRLEDKLGSKYVVNYPAQRGQIVTQQLATYQQGLSFFSMIALFVGGFLIYNAFTMTIVERTQEIGLLRALGLSRAQVTRLILIEAVILGVIGSILGVAFGLVMARGMMVLMSAVTATEIIAVTVPLDGLLLSLGVGLGVTLISAFLPAFKASHISPLAALRVRGQESPSSTPGRLALFAGIELVVVAVVTINYVPLRSSVVFQLGSAMVFVMFLGATLTVPAAVQRLEKLFRPIIVRLFGTEGRVGSSNIERSRGRVSLTVAALMTGIAMVISIGAMGRSFQTDIDGWVNSAVGGDLLVRSPVPMRIDFGSRLAVIPGVAAVTPARYFGVKPANDDLGIVFQALDPATYFSVAAFQYAEDKEDAAQIERDLAAGQLLLSTTVADRYGLKRGDTFELQTRRGVQAFRVAGLVSDFTSQGYVINGALETMRRYFGINDVDRFTLKLAPGADLHAVKQAIEDKYGQSRHVQVETTEDFRSRVRELTNRAFGLLDVLANIGVLVAALGVINTMMMNVLERQREIGSLRSIGMTRAQVIRMILAESGAMGAVGAVFGVGFGILLSRVFVEGMRQMTGYRLTFELPPNAVLNGILIAFLVSQIAALYPAWRASRVNIIEAIKHE